MRGGPGTVGGPQAPMHVRGLVRIAWIALAVVPVAFVAAMLIGDGLLSLQGYEPGAAQSPPIGYALLANSLPLILGI